MIVEKIPEFTSYKQSEWFEKFLIFSTQKRKRAKNEFEKDLYKFLINASVGKTLENLKKKLKSDFIKNND